jgi:hypothetical protein
VSPKAVVDSELRISWVRTEGELHKSQFDTAYGKFESSDLSLDERPHQRALSTSSWMDVDRVPPLARWTWSDSRPNWNIS